MMILIILCLWQSRRFARTFAKREKAAAVYSCEVPETRKPRSFGLRMDLTGAAPRDISTSSVPWCLLMRGRWDWQPL